MMKNKMMVVMVLVGLMLLLSVSIVGAQDVTPEAAASDVAAAVPEAGVTAEAEPVPDTTVTIPLWVALIGGSLLALGGAAAGGGGVFVILTRWAAKLLDDKNSLRNAEMLANSAPEWAVTAGFEFARFMQAGGKLLEEVTDKVPVAEK